MYLQYFCKFTVSKRFSKILIFADSTTDAGRSFHGIKTLLTLHNVLALTRAGCSESLYI